MNKDRKEKDAHDLPDEQIAENLTDLVSIINAKGHTKRIEKIIDENPSCCDDDDSKSE
ncbi:hypothetical protein [Bacillus sp. B-jedd]|uniref:hypothetical protein n=1 Tax=Bacillus sp. B-jedd TaxID=1476857 RepID=UPI0005155DC4|nr:hypothetical protein [Bacillus sp. B-jedd]CEG27000.1 hypothetical protein BN1002_01856 [Bacillus sp. B-jedd]